MSNLPHIDGKEKDWVEEALGLRIKVVGSPRGERGCGRTSRCSVEGTGGGLDLLVAEREPESEQGLEGFGARLSSTRHDDSARS